jgi:hypothetical protein
MNGARRDAAQGGHGKNNPNQSVTPPQKKGPPMAAADATAVRRMSPAEPQPFGDSVGSPSTAGTDEFAAETARRANVMAGRKSAEQAAATGTAGQLDSDLAAADRNLRKKP